ncbi:response regulator [Paenibacillus harenae]|uniref:response regulator n=1 Tax=Paenibacillus harenae TaxID=306543 RepID=UPI0027900B5F|nr:response regulator [Paenibacillus harenae]MDQ0062537.1 two-component system response regulator YesN [Paenibacillus harenae]
MFTAIIAEDSKPILRNIKALLESSQLEIRVVATAYNGEEALDYLHEHPVDILLTDIRMPKLDGLALIEQAKLLHPQLKVLLISSYSDFEYTRKALNLQVFDYLLKPVERPQLLEVMERMIDQLKKDKRSELEPLRGMVDPAYLHAFELSSDPLEQISFLFVLGKQPFTEGADKWHAQLLQNELSAASAPYKCRVLPLNASNRFIVLLQKAVKEKFPTAAAWMNAVRSRLLEIGVHLSMAGSFQTVERDKMGPHCEQYGRKLDNELNLTASVLLDTDFPIVQQRWDNKALIRDFIDMIHQRQKERFTLKLAEQLQKWQTENRRIGELEDLLNELTNAFIQALPEDELEERMNLAADIPNMFEPESYSHFSSELLKWSEKSFELLHARNRKSGEELFAQINGYVLLHKYSQLSIADLAQKFHVSPSYISRIIKRYTNSTFVHYYMQLKIEEACRLMEAKPELMVKEVSDALSFSDQHYFSRVFKEYAGCSPTEYKEKLRSQT